MSPRTLAVASLSSLLLPLVLLPLLLPSPSRAQPASWLSDIASMDKLWTPADSAVSGELLPIVGNGLVATQVADDTLYVAGLFNGKTTGNGFGPCHRAAIPADVGALAGVPAPGAPADAALDVRRATYFRRSFLDPSGACSAASNASCATTAQSSRVWVEQRFYAHRAMPSVFVMEVELLAEDGRVEARGDPGAEPVAYLKLSPTPAYNASDVNLTLASAAPAAVPVRTGWTQIPETPATPLQGLAIVSSNTTCADTASGLWPFAALGSVRTFLTVVRTTIETAGAEPELVAAAQADFAAASAMAANGTALLDAHVAEWASSVWTAGFEVDGRPDVARAINSSLYSLFSSARADRPFGLSPGGLTAGYYGHTMWDQESWMFPAINFFSPALAESLLQYRVDRIAAAEARAAGYRPPYAGTMFPWQSALSGFETTPSFASYGPDREVHVNGDIALAAVAYFRGTGDAAWLAAKGYPLLAGVAAFWVSKIALSGNPPPALLPNASDLLHIRDVVGPDEYHDHVDDSAYTNAVATLSLRYAAQAAALLRRDPEAAAQWADYASRIFLPFNASGHPGIPAGGLHPEFDRYALGVTVKQADTILLAFPLAFEHATMTAAAIANDLAYYCNHTDTKNGPAMTWAMFHVGYVGLGADFADAASLMLNQSFALNAWPPFATWMESPGGRGTPNFLTGAGGFLQGVLSGYPGLRLTDSALALLAPQLPPGAERVTLRGLAYLGARFDVTLSAAALTVALRAGGAARGFALVDAAGAQHALAPGVPLTLAPQGVRIVAAAVA